MYNWQQYEVLIALEDCKLVGEEGWLITDRPYRTLVVDCEAPQHKGQLKQRNLLGDVNRKDLVHKRAWFIISKYRSWLMSKQCTYDNCEDRAIAGFYVGQGEFELACPEHTVTVIEENPLGVPFILDNVNEEVVDYLTEHNDANQN